MRRSPSMWSSSRGIGRPSHAVCPHKLHRRGSTPSSTRRRRRLELVTSVLGLRSSSSGRRGRGPPFREPGARTLRARRLVSMLKRAIARASRRRLFLVISRLRARRMSSRVSTPATSSRRRASGTPMPMGRRDDVRRVQAEVGRRPFDPAIRLAARGHAEGTTCLAHVGHVGAREGVAQFVIGPGPSPLATTGDGWATLEDMIDIDVELVSHRAEARVVATSRDEPQSAAQVGDGGDGRVRDGAPPDSTRVGVAQRRRGAAARCTGDDPCGRRSPLRP